MCRRTIDNWIATIPEFSDAVRQGREVADESVVSALLARATGMEQKMTKVFCHGGQPVTANYTVQLPPDVRDQIASFDGGPGYVIVSSVISLPIYAVFSMAGALLALLIFRKPTAPAAQA